MKKGVYLLALILLFSCSTKKKESQKLKCVIVSSEKIPIVSVMDEINRKQKWKLKTDCSTMIFVSEKQYSVGDSVEVERIRFN